MAQGSYGEEGSSCWLAEPVWLLTRDRLEETAALQLLLFALLAEDGGEASGDIGLLLGREFPDDCAPAVVELLMGAAGQEMAELQPVRPTAQLRLKHGLDDTAEACFRVATAELGQAISQRVLPYLREVFKVAVPLCFEQAALEDDHA
jgi:hypothetical protein